MSGGSYDYMYSRIEDTYAGKTYDAELDEMICDLAKVLYELEWWRSGDTSEEDYRKSLQLFKDKWFGHRDGNLRKILLAKLNDVRIEIEQL